MSPDKNGYPPSTVTDHPAPLGELTGIFERRNIAVGIDRAGQTILARPDSLLARVPDSTRRESLAKWIARYDEEQASRLRDDDGSSLPFVKVTLGPVEPETPNGESRWTFTRLAAAMRELAELDPPVRAEINHVVFGEQVVKGNPLGAPATWAGDMAFVGEVLSITDEHGAVRKVLRSTAEPTVEPRGLARPLGIDQRPSPRVLVLDTGLRTVPDEASREGSRRPEHPYLLHSCRVHDTWRSSAPRADGTMPIDDEDEPDDDASKTLDFEGGHGTFIAGIVAQLCPDAEIYVSGVLSSFGDGDVDAVVSGLRAGLAASKEPIDIVVMSFGAFFAEDDAGTFGEALSALLGDEVLAIAAAGNQGSCRKFFPAAMPGVVGVGALAPNGRAWFSNYGGWVDACAPGVDVVSTFFSFDEDLGRFPRNESLVPRTYEWWASWSGTSFAAPKVAGVLAQDMYLSGSPGGALISAREAWRRRTTPDRLRVADLGVVFNA